METQRGVSGTIDQIGGPGRPEAGRDADSAPRLVPRRHYLRWALGLIVTVYVVAIVVSFVTNEKFNWVVVGRYLFDPMVLAGLGNTLLLTVVSMTAGLILGYLVAEMALSDSTLLRAASVTFVWVFRSLPLLVLLLLLYNVGALYDVIPIGLPFIPPILTLPTSGLSAFAVAIIAFSLHEAAYSSEIIRASIQSVPRGQLEAARALGMTRGRTMRRVIFPSAIRVALPPLMNQIIMMLKGTAIVAFIAFPDLLFSIQRIYTVNYEVMPLLIVASIWYFIIVSVATVLQRSVEHRMARVTRRRGAAAGPVSVGKARGQ